VGLSDLKLYLLKPLTLKQNSKNDGRKSNSDWKEGRASGREGMKKEKRKGGREGKMLGERARQRERKERKERRKE
jgi:hypothetical protein